MGIIQTNKFICEVCWFTSTTTNYDVDTYSDPVVLPPDGEEWGYAYKDGVEKFMCPSCYEKYAQKVESPDPYYEHVKFLMHGGNNEDERSNSGRREDIDR